MRVNRDSKSVAFWLVRVVVVPVYLQCGRLVQVGRYGGVDNQFPASFIYIVAMQAPGLPHKPLMYFLTYRATPPYV
jgi:hypothetical protein